MIANKIHDEFTGLGISRQRKYQLRKKRDGKCTECGEPVLKGSRCLKHLVASRERQRLKRGLKRRYVNTLSYKLEQLATANGLNGQAIRPAEITSPLAVKDIVKAPVPAIAA